jgi:hypothetical protein
VTRILVDSLYTPYCGIDGQNKRGKKEMLLVFLAQATTLWLAIRLLLKTQFSTGRIPDVLELIWAISGK